MSGPSKDQIDALRSFDTPTICNALEIVVPERRGHGFTRTHLHFQNVENDTRPMVGFARCATIRAGMPSTADAATTSSRRAAYYSYVADGDQPKISIIQDLDSQPGVGAFWGEVNTAIHSGLGCEGVVTNGSIRDLTDFAPGFSALAGVVGPSHAHVHVVDFNISVEVAGMTVQHDDLIHADQHGAVVVPVDVVAAIPDAIDMIARKEAVLIEAARAPGFDIDKLLVAMSKQAEIH